MRPIFIIGCPRSGTSLLFTLLMSASSLWSIGDDGEHIWERYYHPSRRRWNVSVLGPANLIDESRAFIGEAFCRASLPGKVRRWLASLPRGATPIEPCALAVVRALRSIARAAGGERPIRLLDRTPGNCFRIPLIRALFPDAQFIYLKRDGRSAVNSLLEGWRTKARRKAPPTYSVPEDLRIPGYEGTGWNYILPPAWRQCIGRPLEEVCSHQWMASNETVLEVADELEREGKMLAVKYEDIVQTPSATLRTITAFLGLPFERHMERFDRALPVVAAFTAPEADKWKTQNPEAIQRVLPLIRPTMARMGYEA